MNPRYLYENGFKARHGFVEKDSSRDSAYGLSGFNVHQHSQDRSHDNTKDHGPRTPSINTIIFKISTAVVFILSGCIILLVIIIINPQRTAEFRQESQPLSRGLEAIGIKQKFKILFNWHFSTRRVFSEGQPRQHVKVKGLIQKQISWKLNLQERKSVKIGGVTKAPEESGGGNSLQFLQVHFKLFLRDELQNLLFFLTRPP